MTTAKPKRLKFSEEEKFIILEEFSLRKDILIPKSGRYKNTMDRQRAWEEITAAVNSLSPLVQRTPDEIRKKWHNMVIDARKELTTVKHPLLRQRPQERLFHNIFALFNKTGPELAEPLLPGSAFRTKPASGPARITVPVCAAGVILEPSSDLFHSQNDGLQPNQRHELLCKREVLLDTDREMAAGTASPGNSLIQAPGEPQPCEDTDSKEDLCLGEPQKSVEKKLLGPSKDPPLTCAPGAETPPVPIHRTTSPLSPGPEVLAPGRTPVPLNSSPDFALTYKIKSPLSPVLEWPCLGVTSSPVTQSSRTDSPSSEGIHAAMDDNASASVTEDSLLGRRGCVGPAKELWEKHSQLHTEILELQKETLQLQKEKILLEKEKLLLEIVKLRRELDT
ncbi:myb-related transcription factor, partner of profilin-like [Emydura macquarii macquarii]|uniref:myb-related transcription factor, partner of profilin-like n=1 Tax=Emydura macquarii macquarii TaxID=1129001 RepID=UPI00352A8F90